MKRHYTKSPLTAALALAILLSGSSQLGAAPPQAAQQKGAAPAADPHRAMLDQYCVTCHNQRAKTAGLMFDKMDLANAGQDGEIWEKAIRKLRGGMMPPPGSKRPDPAAVESFVSFLETTLDKAAAANPDPGNVALHRLNRSEYSNAMRDLFAIDVDAATLLPTDDISGSFDNIANVLKVSPSFLDQYITAAREVTRLAIGTPMPAGPAKVTLRGTDASLEAPLGARGGTLARHLFPADGEYDFQAAGGGILTLDGSKIPPGRVAVKAGYHVVSLASPAPSFVESDTMLQTFVPGQGGAGFGGGGGRGGRGGGGGAGVTVTGPYNPTGTVFDTPNRQKVFVCHPASEADEIPCATRIFSNIAHRAFRRPITDKDLTAPIAFFKQGRATGDFEAGLQSGLIAILASPKFLYRAEPSAAAQAPGSVARIADLELASRLSFFLWSSIPDDELLGLAEQGKLKDPKIFEAQVRRMLADDKAKSLVSNFAFEWLRVREIQQFDPDAIVYPNYDANLKNAFRREMDLFLNAVIREDRSVVDLLNADYTFVNERLAAHYGIPNVRGDYFRRVTLADSRRWGRLIPIALRRCCAARSFSKASWALRHRRLRPMWRRSRKTRKARRHGPCARLWKRIGPILRATPATGSWIRSASRLKILIPSAAGAPKTSSRAR
jgi:mono/diheme cytochrome c family protein